MSDITWLKVTKFQQPLLITLGVADEKPEGPKSRRRPPPAEDRLNYIPVISTGWFPHKLSAVAQWLSNANAWLQNYLLQNYVLNNGVPSTCGRQPKKLCLHSKAKFGPSSTTQGWHILFFSRSAHKICSHCGHPNLSATSVLHKCPKRRSWQKVKSVSTSFRKS